MLPAEIGGFSTFSHAGDGELSGDTKLACEAILCLSSGTRPSECAPSIRRFFSIKHKKLHKQLSPFRILTLPMMANANVPLQPSVRGWLHLTTTQAIL